MKLSTYQTLPSDHRPSHLEPSQRWFCLVSWRVSRSSVTAGDPVVKKRRCAYAVIVPQSTRSWGVHTLWIHGAILVPSNGQTDPRRLQIAPFSESRMSGVRHSEAATVIVGRHFFSLLSSLLRLTEQYYTRTCCVSALYDGGIPDCLTRANIRKYKSPIRN